MQKTTNLSTNMVQLLKDDDSFSSEDTQNYEEASLSSNELITWAKFILTDNMPNEKKMRVPEEEFDNLIKSGVFMPIKMAESTIKDDHKDAEPLGVITHLKKVRNQVVGLAALWKKEREDDINMIKEKFDKNEPINLSWEIVYGNKRKDENGVTDLLDTSLRAATIVGMPAYAGRTTFTALASKDQEEILEELEKLQKEFDELKESHSSVLVQLEETKKELETSSTELDELRSYKDKIEAAKKREDNLKEIKEKFSSVKLEKDDEYFEKNSDMLLGLEEGALDFLIQEMAAFASLLEKEDEEDKEENSSSVPNLKKDKEESNNPKELAKRARKALYKEDN